jgi:amidophosphoribosyltransferase
MCGVFGIFGHPEAANMAYLGLHALQHRGQEACGIASSDGQQLSLHRSLGLVGKGFGRGDLERLPGEAAIGHVRYSTAGTSNLRNAQPFAVDYAGGSLAVAHNGNLTNHERLRQELEDRGSIFQTNADTEAIVHLIAISKAVGLEQRIVDALGHVEGAYSLLFLSRDKMIAVRDPMGIRPLCLGMLPAKDDGTTRSQPAYVISSEPASFDLIGARLLRDVEPGEVVTIDADGLHSEKPFALGPRRMCLFEYVYFARPDSRLDGAEVYQARTASGRRLIEEHPVEGATADDTVVIPVPDSGMPAAIGLSNHARLPFAMGLIRSHYVGRTFIEPQQSIRHFGVRLKLNPNASTLRGKRVIVVDDSIVRGTTSRKLVGMLRGAGATEVHVRISSPPTMWPCYYGIDTPTRAELIASQHSVDEIRSYLDADSLGYLSLEGLKAAVAGVAAEAAGERAGEGERFCHACFSGSYPVPVMLDPEPSRPHQLRLVNG